MTANFSNRTLWTGDNLDVMRGMNGASVDLIYLDPPFNSKREYSAPIGSEAAGAAFKDTWTLSDVDEAWHGEIADRQPALYAIIDAAGLAHGKGMKSYLIMMAVRLLEMHRVLKPTGSIYLHCDPTASHYLKMLMDAVFGKANFRSEIVWRRSNAHNKTSRQYGPIHDTVFYYTRGKHATFRLGFRPYAKEYVRRSFPYEDSHGRYQSNVLTGSGVRSGESGEEWRCYDPTPHGRHWAVTSKIFKFIEVEPSAKLHDILEAMDRAGLILHPKKKTGLPRYKQYLDDSLGVPYQDVWAFQPGTQNSLWSSSQGIDEDVKWLDGEKERVGYPTQKPLGLLNRIITVSSNEGDVVLDPFCGCATTLVAADRLNRRWAGIDLSPLAAKLVLKRIRDDRGPLFDDVRHRTDIPVRTDLGKLPNYRTHRHTLYGQQEGRCAGCRVLFPFRNMTVDHIVPRSKGGQDNIENLQLLCAACNSTKGAQTQERLITILKRDGIR